MPSAKILESKKAIVKGLVEELKDAQSIVLTDYQGLNVAQDTEMRAKLREEGVTYKVVKNTYMRLAFKELGIDGLDEELIGPTALAFSTEDVVLAPRLSKKFQDEFKKTEIKGGIMEGKKVPLDTIMQLANIPETEVLYGQLVSSLIFPVRMLAMTLNALAEKAEEAGKENVKDMVVENAEEAAPAEENAEEKAEAAEEVKEEKAEEAPAEEAEEKTEEETAE